MDETVTFSENAVFSIERGSSHIARTTDEELTMEQCLYAIMLESANECANAVAEHIAAHFEAAAAGKTFPRYELCPARLYPYGQEEGEPAFFEENGHCFIARGAKAIAERIRAGAPLIALERAEKGEGACTAAAVRAWEERTGVRFPALPACAE